jgi:hypothetical protein
MRTQALISALLLCACGQSLRSGDERGVHLRVEPESVSVPGSVTLVLSNESPEEVGYNLCTSSLERSVAGSWQAVPSDRVCTMELRMLPPGDEARLPLELPADLASGEYRFLTSVEMTRVGDQGPVRSEAFRIAE